MPAKSPRKALLEAAAHHLLERQLSELDTLPEPQDFEELVGSVTAILVAADPGSRTRHLPRFELFLEAARGPDLLPVLAAIRQAIIEGFMARLLDER